MGWTDNLSLQAVRRLSVGTRSLALALLLMAPAAVTVAQQPPQPTEEQTPKSEEQKAKPTEEQKPKPTEEQAVPAVNEEITVTARKREETLQDVPFSVAAPTEDMLRSRGAENIEGVAANVA